jgi:hypothetical protein
MYASFLVILRSLYLNVFDQPVKYYFFNNLVMCGSMIYQEKFINAAIRRKKQFSPQRSPLGHELPSGLSLRVEDRAEWQRTQRKKMFNSARSACSAVILFYVHTTGNH